MISLRKQIPWITLAIGCTLSCGIYVFFAAAERETIRAEFVRRSQVIVSVIETSLRNHETTLFSLRNLLHYSDHVTRTEFAGAAEDLFTNQNGIQALEWIERVPAARRAEVEQGLRAEGFANFEIKQRGKSINEFVRSANRPEHYPVIYVHPMKGNEAALGFDLASGITWTDMQRAARENILTTSGRLPLITDGKAAAWGYLLELPVYQLPVPATPEGRMEKLRGFVIGIFRIDEIIEGSIQRLDPQGVDFLVVDGNAQGEKKFLHHHFSRLRKQFAAAGSETDFLAEPFHHVIDLQLPERAWKIYTRPAPEWLAQRRNFEPLAVLCAGLVSSVLLSIYLNGILRRTDVIEKQVDLRTRELRDSETRLQAILDHNPNAIFVKNLDGRYVLVNRHYERCWAIAAEAVIGRTDEEMFSPDIAADYRRTDAQVLATGEAVRFEHTVDLPNQQGQLTALVQKFALRDAEGKIYGICGISTDITDRKLAEQEKLSFERKLLEAQKLESLGVLAGGIAHDFNNILTSVLANAAFANRSLGPANSAASNLEQIENAARRAADLCQQMLAYAGKGQLIAAPVNLSEIVRGTTSLIEISINKNTRVKLQLAPSLPAVIADATQLRQIVMNLVINAADAIGGATGTVTVTTYPVRADTGLLRRALGQPDLPPGDYVGLSVSDTGCGMNPATMARIFEPFFTTKFSGRGLGLAAVLGIVQSHRGALFVESEVGRGSTFRLLLPAVEAPAKTVEVPSDSTPRAATLRGTVLVVDDEPSVRLVASEVMRIHGARTVVASSGEQALQLAVEHRADINLVLLDMTMPGLSGEETLRQLRAAGISCPVVIMSGYSEADSMRRTANHGVSGFVQKPFEIESLVAAAKPFLS